MAGRELRTNDLARALLSSGQGPWSWGPARDSSTRRRVRRAARAVVLAATPRRQCWCGNAPLQLTHVGRRERKAPGGAMARRIQLLGDAPGCPAPCLALPPALAQRGHIRHLLPGTHRPPHGG